MTTRIRTEHSENPVIINRFDVGLITNRDPLHVPTVYTGHSMYVSGDALIDGLNTEITNNNRLGRRPGFPPYCSVAIPAGNPLNFGQLKTDSITKFLDTTTDVFSFSSSAITSVYTKATTSPSRFQQVANHLYWVDGTNARRLVTALDGLTSAKWGIDAPSSAPGVSQVAISGLPAWAANTFYNPSLTIFDSNSNVQKLTTAGTTGGSEPSWNTTPGGTTNDGSAVWTMQASGTRAINTAYSSGAYIVVTSTTQYSYQQWNPYINPPYGGYETVFYSISASFVFKATTAGTSSSTATASITWPQGAGASITDGTVVWTNVGKKLVWSDIGATTLVSLATAIIDANGNQENITTPGKTGGSAPTWATAKGALTVDNAAIWSNAGAISPTNTAAWKYVYVYRQSAWNFGETWYHISSASSVSLPIVLSSGYGVSVAGTYSANDAVTDVDIYRTKQGGSVYYYAGTLPNIIGTRSFVYNDTLSDDLLDTSKTVSTVPLNLPPPSGASLVAFWQGRVWLASGSNVYFDGGGDITNGDPHQSFPLANVFPYAGNVTALTPTDDGLIVWIGDESHIILGGPQTLTFFTQPLFNKTGVKSQDAVIADRDQVFCYTSQRQALTFSPSDLGEFGYNVADFLQTTFSPSSTYLTTHRNGPDVGVFMSDGVDNIMRFNPTASCWSPVATIAAGCGPIASIEIEDGTFALLTTINGYICKRDLNTFTDGHAAATYTAFGTIGSLEVAAMSQPTKALRHVFVRSTDQGTRASVGMLQNSKSGTFSDVPYACSVPAKLDGTPLQVTDIRQERFDIQQSELIALDQFNHFQVKFSWPAENFKNEISAFSVGDTAR